SLCLLVQLESCSIPPRRSSDLKCLLTTSCTDALEMAAILLNIQEGDEVIMPSFTFVSTANAFILRGAHIVFADSMENNPNMDAKDRKSTRLNSSHVKISYAVFC